MKDQLNEVKRLKKLAGINEASLPGGMMPTSGDNAHLSVDLNSPSVADMADDFQGNMDAFAKYIQTVLQDAGIEAQAQVKFKPLRVDIQLTDPSQREAAVLVLNREGLDMVTSEEITMEGDEVTEARGGQLQPIDPAALKRVIALGVKSEVLGPQDAPYLIKRFAAIPVLVNKAVAGDEKAYYDVMAGGEWPYPEYSNADDKRLAKYYEKLSDLMAAVDAVMYEGELEVIPSRWNKLKAHIEGMQ